MKIVYKGCFIPPRVTLLKPATTQLKPYAPTYTKWQRISSILKIFAPLYISVLLAGILISWSTTIVVFILVGLFYLFVFLGAIS